MALRRTARCAGGAAVLAVGAFALLPATPARALALPHAITACGPAKLRASLTSSETSARGAGLELAETNVSANRCTISSPLVVQLLTPNGKKVVPAVSSPPFTTSWVLPSYQGTFAITTRASSCAHASRASAIRVTSGAATSVIHLTGPIPVCAVHPHALTVSPVTFPHPAPCHGPTLPAEVGWSNGALGTIYYSIVFRNPGATACTLHGVATVRPIDGHGNWVGPPAVREQHLPGRGGPMVLGVNDHVDAWAAYGVTETGNYPVARCGPADAAAIVVTLPGYAPTTLPLAISVCTKLASTFAQGVAPRWVGF